MRIAIRIADCLTVAVVCGGAVLAGVAGALSLWDRLTPPTATPRDLAQRETPAAPRASIDPGVTLKSPAASAPPPAAQGESAEEPHKPDGPYGLSLQVMRDPPHLSAQRITEADLEPAVTVYGHADDPNVADAVRIRLAVDRTAYVCLLMVDPQGRIRTVLPAEPTGAAMLLTPGRPTYLPELGAPLEFTVSPPAGEVRLIAIAADRPWRFTDVPRNPATAATPDHAGLPLAPTGTRIDILHHGRAVETHPNLQDAFGENWQTAGYQFRVLSPENPFPVGRLVAASYRG
ncbi:MAG: DUF4384 domain-containing protein [Planctomycetota bacterium]